MNKEELKDKPDIEHTICIKCGKSVSKSNCLITNIGYICSDCNK